MTKTQWQICFDDSGESEEYGEGNWYISNAKGEVLFDMSFVTQEEAEQFLKECEED